MIINIFAFIGIAWFSVSISKLVIISVFYLIDFFSNFRFDKEMEKIDKSIQEGLKNRKAEFYTKFIIKNIKKEVQFDTLYNATIVFLKNDETRNILIQLIDNKPFYSVIGSTPEERIELQKIFDSFDEYESEWFKEILVDYLTEFIDTEEYNKTQELSRIHKEYL